MFKEVTIYRKLTTPLARRRNAGAQSKIRGKLKARERKRKIDEARSIMLKTSPVNTNKPFTNNSPAQNSKRKVRGVIPKISMRKTAADRRSTRPRIFTSTIN